jgi:hypothetical protein
LFFGRSDMHDFYVHGPTLTYVNDPALTLPEQQRVLTDLMRCSSDQMLRVAFRMPGVRDNGVRTLVEWYLRAISKEGVAEAMLPPLVHNRPQVAVAYPETRLWMPSRAIGHNWPASVYSVHSLAEARAAVDAGASEVIYGHVFPSASHPGERNRGIESLQALAESLRVDINEPIVTAIGGIAPNTIRHIGRARVFSVACITAISRSPDICATLNEMRLEWLVDLIDRDLQDDQPWPFGREWNAVHGVVANPGVTHSPDDDKEES